VSDEAAPSRWAGARRALRIGIYTAGAVTALATPWWIQHLEYFRVRRVEIVGSRYVPPATVLAALALDSTASLWARLAPLETRVARHPQVLAAVITRKLPGTLVVTLRENLPVALVQAPDGLNPYDADARPLPIDPSQTPLDLPLVARRDAAALRLLGDLQQRHAALFARVSEVRWDEDGGMRVLLTGVTVRTDARTTAQRFTEILPVEADLTRRGVRARELDLRYRDQIVARIE
jgi:cell division protein FtsQ